MKKKGILILVMCAALLFVMGFAYGGYRGTKLQATSSMARLLLAIPLPCERRTSDVPVGYIQRFGTRVASAA